jgi:MFS superfamily sulfate permease-like transporter
VTTIIKRAKQLDCYKPLAYKPTAVLATVVFSIGLDLIDVKGMQGIYKERPAEFWVALFTTLMVVFVGVKEGIVWAIILSILIHLPLSDSLLGIVQE